jgi:hypothetical protein
MLSGTADVPGLLTLRTARRWTSAVSVILEICQQPGAAFTQRVASAA